MQTPTSSSSPSSPPPTSTTTVAAAAEEPAPPLSLTGGIRVSEMEAPHSLDETSTIWEWGSLLDFNMDDQLNISWSPDYHTINPSSSTTVTTTPSTTEPAATESMSRGGGGSDSSDKVRKRDPRLTCENFLAGIVPCACPELDEKLEEEGEIGKKRARKGSLVIIRCQVPGCEVDISELKGYHRRHRVCLGCANAASVFLEGQTKRYCQQCGKFHIISDFDEGKRSCRRKLERHNKRRRRKSTDSKGAIDKQSSGDIIAQDLDVDGEEGKDNLCSSDQRVDEPLVETEDGHVSPICSVPSSQDIRSDSGITSLVASGESQKDHGKDNSILTLSSSFCDNKSAYSSTCPTGRISFKLYDWNPAEFPRRLRHQIFQWLSSMPVELEGYIRPGCIILTVFIAMPRFMWEKLRKDGASYVNHFVSTPDNMLFGRGRIIVHLNDRIFRTPKGGTSLANVEAEMQAPRLHYVHPTYFEAGKPIEFVACGSNLFQPKFRFLVSFAGKYLVCDSCLAIPHGKIESCHGNEMNGAQSCDHQVYKIYIASTEQKFFGPAFIEVENESGLSNFIPVLLGDRQTCSELQMVEQRFDESLYSKMSQVGDHDATSESCKVLVVRQTAMSELILDVAWLLKEPKSDDKFVTSADIQRLNCLLGFLIQNGSTFILRKILQSFGNIMDVKKSSKPVTKTNDADTRLFQKYIVHARELVNQRAQHPGQLVQHSESSFAEEEFVSHRNTENGTLHSASSNNQNMLMGLEKRSGSVPTSKWDNESYETIPLLNRDVVMNVNHQQQHLVKLWPTTSCRRILSSTMTCSRPLALLVTVVALCSGICAVLLHPQKVGEIAVSIRRCMSGYSNP